MCLFDLPAEIVDNVLDFLDTASFFCLLETGKDVQQTIRRRHKKRLLEAVLRSLTLDGTPFYQTEMFGEGKVVASLRYQNFYSRRYRAVELAMRDRSVVVFSALDVDQRDRFGAKEYVARGFIDRVWRGREYEEKDKTKLTSANLPAFLDEALKEDVSVSRRVRKSYGNTYLDSSLYIDIPNDEED